MTSSETGFNGIVLLECFQTGKNRIGRRLTLDHVRRRHRKLQETGIITN